jgi:hypothetical protein
MTTPAAFDLLTIGHSNLPAARFLALLQNAGVTAVADVRSVPFSRRFPWFSGKALAERLRGSAITYTALGDALGGRPRDPTLYCDGIADYDAMAATAAFRAGLDRVVDDSRRQRLCLMCAEREPLDDLTTLAAPAEKVFFFTELIGMGGKTVTHKWSLDGNAMADVAISVGGDRWRCYSTKTLDAGKAGKGQRLHHDADRTDEIRVNGRLETDGQHQ